MTDEQLRKALSKAWNLGQEYWRQADSDSYKQQDKSEVTRQSYLAFVEETVAILQAATRDAPLGSGECFIVKGSGETDLPVVHIVRDLEAARQAVLSLMYSDPADADDTEELFDDFDERMLNDEHWDIAFEIGGISVERVCLDPIAPKEDGND